VHGGGIERVVAAVDAQEAGRLLEGLVAQTRHILQLLARLEGAVLVAMSDDVVGKRRRQAGDARSSGTEAVFTSTPTEFTQSSTTASSDAPAWI
jgi:hypothetical protein